MLTRIELFILSCWFNAAVSFSMVALVLFSRPITRVKILWSSSCFAVGIWSICLGMMTGTNNYELASRMVIHLTTASVWIPTFLYHMVHSLLNKKNKWPLLLVYLITSLFTILSLNGLLNDVRPIADFYFYTSAKPFYAHYTIYMYLMFLVIGLDLWIAYRNSSPPQKRHILLLLIGIELGWVGGQTSIPLVYGFNFFPWGLFFVPVYVVAVAYSMMKYQFMDFKLAAKKLSLGLTIYVCLALLVAPFVYPALEKILKTYPEIRFPLFAIGLTYTMVIAIGGLIYAFLIQRSFWLKSHMTMGLAHELKSPLANIRSALEYLATSPKSDDYLDILRRNTARLETFVEDLLNLASIQDDNVHIERKPFSFTAMVSSVCEVYKPLVESKGLKLVLDTCPDPISIEGDEAKLRQVVSNLLSNAVKFSDKGTIRVELSVMDQKIQCSVSDEGPGISKENAEKVFDRFFQEKKSTRGAGLGLAIAKAWVEAHGGRIWLPMDQNNRGACFIFTLPYN